MGWLYGITVRTGSSHFNSYCFTTMFGSIDLTLRPIRLAFLVDPKSSLSVRKAIHTNCTLWGGSHNPLIPLYRRTPEVWADRPFPPPKAEEVTKGYIDAFDPDVLVKCTNELPSYIEKCGLQVIDVEKIWRDENTDIIFSGPRFGVGIFELLDEIFESHFRYTERFPIKIVIPELPRSYSMFWSSVFGQFPSVIFNVVTTNYKNALNIETPKLRTSILNDLLKNENLFPRRITLYGLDSFRRSIFDHDDSVFFMDANHTGDVIDYWNLRALGKQVIPVPKHLKNDDSLRKIVIDFLRSARRPRRENPTIYRYASMIKGRHVTAEEMHEFGLSLDVRRENDEAPSEPYFVYQNWYPRIWDNLERQRDAAADIFGERKSVDFNDTRLEVQFTPIRPRFMRKYIYHGEPRCANEIAFRFYGADQLLAEALPRSGGDNLVRALISFAGRRSHWRIGRNGLVKLVEHDRSEHWSIPLAQDVFFAWLKDHGWSAELFNSGLIARQLLTQFEGRIGVLANEKLLKFFEHMNGGPVEEREMPVAEVKSRLKEMTSSSHFHDYLVSKNVFRVGAKVRCPHCSRNSWHSLDDISQQMICPKCLNNYPAPGNIDSAVWSYKTAGPFSIRGYADGAYTVLLSINFFDGFRLHTIKTTPALSFRAKDKQRVELEADFGLLWQETSFRGVVEGIVFGECKTFGVFERRDFQRMTRLARQFPGAVLAFCTLRPHLNRNELNEIAKIARAGRKYWKDDRPINPVLILTANELLARWGPPECWEQIGYKDRFRNTLGLLSVCNATQQIYLNMPPWEHQWHDESGRRRIRRIRR